MSKTRNISSLPSLRRLPACLGLTALMVLAALSAAAEQAVIVLDGSGSMWGRIDGTPKIAIARDALAEVLRTMPGDLALGLIAYGHREKGNCGDIELLVPPAPGSGAAIAAAAAELSPKGKTPLSASVRQAAELLRYTEEKATVIAITDGLETCDADPCALGRELEDSGVDFTAHVVGFGLSPEEGRQVACLAEATGGLYIQAGDAVTLMEALVDTVVVAAAAPEPIPEPEPNPPAALPSAAIEAPDEVAIGTLFALTWDGPGEKYDEIILFDPAARGGEGATLHGRRLATSPGYDAHALRLAAPVEPGSYQLRYSYGRGRDVIATRPIAVVDAEVSLSAPAAVDIGATFTAGWVGPGAKRDQVELFDEAAGPDGRVVTAARLINGDFEARSVRLVAPAEPGFYQLRYWSGEGRKALATRQIEILPAEVSIAAPGEAPIGSTFEAAWVGPGGKRDEIEIFDPAAGPDGKVVGSRRVINGDFDGRTVKLIAPATPGDYLLRYWNGENRAVLATRPITVEDAEVALAAPDTVDMGTSFEVVWTGPGATRDSIEILDPAAGPDGKVVGSRRVINGDLDKRSVKLIAPIEPGDYTLRYWNADSRKVLATRPVAVGRIEVAVSGPASVAAGESFTVTWTGPGAYRDAVEVFDAASGKVVTSKRLVNGDYKARTATLKAPKAPGDYRLRYWNGDSRSALAEQALEVR